MRPYADDDEKYRAELVDAGRPEIDSLHEERLAKHKREPSAA